MQTKNVLYAAVGAPVVAARKVSKQVGTLRSRVSHQTASYTESAEKAINGWAEEGERLVTRISEGTVVEEISQKVDLDQAKEQVGKLRDQLEDMLDTWRASFRPEEKTDVAKKPAAEADATSATAKKPASKATASESTASKSGGSKSASAKKTSPSTKSSDSSTAKKSA